MGETSRITAILLSLLVAGCDLVGDDEDSGNGAEQVSDTEASFGIRAIYGLNPASANGSYALAAQFYRNGEHIGAFGKDSTTFKVNGVSAADDRFKFDYEPGKEYSFEASLNGETVGGSITAPSVSDISFVELPDTVCDNQPVTIKWKYPEGERNDGILMLSASGYDSEHLEPGTTSYTIPANKLVFKETVRVQVFTMRSILFRNLPWQEDEIHWGLGYEGSFLTLLLMSEEQKIKVLNSEYEDRCRST